MRTETGFTSPPIEWLAARECFARSLGVFVAWLCFPDVELPREGFRNFEDGNKLRILDFTSIVLLPV